MEEVATDTLWLTAMAVVMDLCHHLPKRSLKLHVADIKNITGDDQANPRVNLNSANIALSFEIFVYEITNDAPWLVAIAITMDAHHRLLKRLLKRHVADVKNIAGDDQAMLMVDQYSVNIMHTIEIYACEIVTDAQQLPASKDRSNCALCEIA